MIATRSRATGTPFPDHDFPAEFGSVSYVPLHESTAPAAIAADQRADVERAWYGRRARTPEEISAVTDLPVWSVRRRLHELGLGPPVPWPKKKTTPKKPRAGQPRAGFNGRGA